MERQKVVSSNIRSIGYDVAQRVLEVEFFSGKVYRYADVPAELYVEMRGAESIGRYFGARVKGVYACEQVDLSTTGG
jgi:hypothetical protein